MESSEKDAEGNNQITEAMEELHIVSIPIDVIFNILVRVPAKSLFRFKSVSKAWLSLIHSALFAATFNTRALESPGERYSLLLIAKDKTTSHRHFLSAPFEGGSTTRLFTLDNIPLEESTEATISNGLVLFHRENGFMKQNFAFIINPTTHEVMKLPGKAAQPRFSYGNAHICYFFGFDPSAQGYKVLNIRIIGLRTPRKRKIECGLFDLGSCSWKWINPVFPFDPVGEWLYWFRENVCIDGVIYILLHKSYSLAAFDLRKESFSLIPLPKGATPSDIATNFNYNGSPGISFNYPYMIDYNGLLAVICIEKVRYHGTVQMWILVDPEHQQWVEETIVLPESSDEGSSHSLPRNVICTGEIMFTPEMINNECLRFPLYDMNKRSFRFIEISVPPLLASDNIQVACHGGYVENILQLRRNPGTSTLFSNS